jgi:glycosyltransferase involved in cell wall biosynthesis
MENHVLELAVAVATRGCQVSAIVPDTPAIAPFVANLREAGIPVDTVTLHSAQSTSTLVAEMLRLRQILRDRGIDIFHQHRTGPYHGKWACLAARMAGVGAVVATEHLPAFPLKGISRLINATADRAVDRIVTVCELDRQVQIRETWRPAAKVVTVHNGIDLSRFSLSPASEPDASVRKELGIDAGAPVLGVIARLSPEKGHRYLFEALPSLVREWPELIVLVAGDGPERSTLEAEAASRGIARHVRFLGPRSDIVRIMQTLDVLVLPSLKESFPIVLLEAMAMRRAAVATNVGGVSEAVLDGETGFVVPPAEPAALGAAIARCLRSEDLKSMGAAGRLRVERHFTAAAMAAKTEALYRELVARI